MNMQERIEKMERELAELKAEYAQSGIDWSKMIGRSVFVRDGDDQEWRGPYELSRYGGSDDPFHADGWWWVQCKLNDTTKINWIDWNGGECPVDGDELVMVKLRSGNIDRLAKAFVFLWEHDGHSGDIVKYTIIRE